MSKEPADRAAASEPAPEPAPESPPADDPEKLLESANEASGPARNAWLAFLGLLAYLLITLAGVGHVDLLLDSPVTLPIVNVKIPLFSFFLAAPYLFLLVHLGLLVQHAMLAHKYQHFRAAIKKSEAALKGEHPDRKLVHNYVFAQMLAGPRPPWPLHMLMRLMVFVTFSLLPVLTLLYFQIKFLPYHDVAITHAHRLTILLDLALLFVVRPFIAMPYLRPQGKKLGFGTASWRWEMSYASLGVAGPLCLVVFLFSLLVATVPHACVWPWGDRSEEREEACVSLDRTMAQIRPVEVESGTQTRKVFAPTKWLFEGAPNETTSTPESLFSRNLVVTDNTDLVEKRDFEEGETSLNLRGRDLRFAVFNRSDLRRADLFGSNLRGAAASATRLDHASLRKADLQGANLFEAQLQGANLGRAQLQGADLGWAQLQGAALVGAQLQGADLGGARIWQTLPPEASGLELAVPMQNLFIAPLNADEKSSLEKLIAGAQDEGLQDRLTKRLAPLLDSDVDQSWEASKAIQAWRDLKSLSRPELADLACSDGPGGYVINGIARRVSYSDEAYAKITAAKLIDEESCPAGKHLSEETLARLKKIEAPEETEEEPKPAK